MSKHDFTSEQQDLHDEVKKLVAQGKEEAKNDTQTNDRTARNAYHPEHDVLILTLLKDRAVEYGRAKTDRQKQICEELSEVLASEHNQVRSIDTLHYRINKLLKLGSLDAMNYRIKKEGAEAPKKTKKKSEKKAEPEAEVEAKTEAEEPAEEPKEEVAVAAAEPEEFSEDDDFLD